MDKPNEPVEESELMYEPAAASPVKRWLLLDGDRLWIAALLATGVFLSVVAVHAAGILRVSDADSIVTLLSALVGGTLPFITIVLAINQLVLSQELGWTDQLRSRFDGMTTFRRQVEETTGTSVSPSSPADFLALIVDGTVSRAETLPGALSSEDERVERETSAVASSLVDQGRAVSTALEEAEFGTFEALSAVLGHHHGSHLHAARTLRSEHPDAFSETDALDELIDLLVHLAVARQTFKTLYMQHELAILSRLLLYVGFPTLFGGGLLILTYPEIVAAEPGQTGLVGIVAVGVTLVFLPFIVLLVYALRIATIASRTADFGPFVPRS